MSHHHNSSSFKGANIFERLDLNVSGSLVCGGRPSNVDPIRSVVAWMMHQHIGVASVAH